jgi:hypothetical protein
MLFVRYDERKAEAEKEILLLEWRIASAGLVVVGVSQMKMAF